MRTGQEEQQRRGYNLLRCVLKTSILIPLAEIHAPFHRHVVCNTSKVDRLLVVERTWVIIISPTPNISPSLRRRNISERRSSRSNNSSALSSTNRIRRSGSRTTRHRIATGKSGKQTLDWFIDLRCQSAGILFLVGELLDDGAGFEGTAIVFAVVNDGLEGCDVPTVYEVAVESVAGVVAVGEDERLFAVAPFAGELVGVIEYFEE